MLTTAHSVPRTDALVALAQADYDLGEDFECRYLSRGLNDTFLLSGGGAKGRSKSDERRFILRVYRAGWRTAAEIRWELDLLAHLVRRLPAGVAVSTPIARRDGALFRAIKAPEGTRHVALFTYAPGAPPPWTGQEQCAAYGGAVAALHNASDDFTSAHARFAVDMEYLVEGPLRSLRRCMTHRVADFDYVRRVAARLRARMEELGDELSWGAGHADLQAKNAHLSTTNGTFTFFDFDCGGATWRAFDLAWCRMEAAQAKEPALWAAFLRGYRERRALSRADHLAVPWLVLAIHIWWMGLIADLGSEWGTSWLDGYLSQQITAIRRWEARRLTGA